VTRELKLALIVGFSLVLIVTVLVSDHLSKARSQTLAPPLDRVPLAMQPEPFVPEPIAETRRAAAREALDTGVPAPELGPVVAAGPVVIHQGEEPSGGLPGFVPAGRTELVTAPVAGEPRPPTIKEPPASPALAERVHVVDEGETLFQIARKYYGAGTAWTKIAQANGIKPESLKVGMKLRVPGVRVADSTVPVPPAAKPADAAARSSFTMYTVKRGDTLEGISTKYLGSPRRLSDLLRANGIEDSDTLNIGQTIKIPNS